MRGKQVDIMEANTHSFHSTLHEATDGAGVGTGLGGSYGYNGIPKGQYGIGGSVIDTQRPYRVHAYFGTRHGQLTHMKTSLEQGDRSVSFSIADPAYRGERDDASDAPPQGKCMHYGHHGCTQWSNARGDADGECARYGQCGGEGWLGPACTCPAGTHCFAQQRYYSQCTEECQSDWICDPSHTPPPAPRPPPYTTPAPSAPDLSGWYGSMSAALASGMTPVFSYWSSDDLGCVCRVLLRT